MEVSPKYFIQRPLTPLAKLVRSTVNPRFNELGYSEITWLPPISRSALLGVVLHLLINRVNTLCGRSCTGKEHTLFMAPFCLFIYKKAWMQTYRTTPLSITRKAERFGIQKRESVVDMQDGGVSLPPLQLS